jgi:hypothetical protein
MQILHRLKSRPPYVGCSHGDSGEQIHLKTAIECKLYNSPHCREHSLRENNYSSIHEERRANQILIIWARCRYLYPVFPFNGKKFLSLPSDGLWTTKAESFRKDLKCRRQMARQLTVHFNLDALIFVNRAGGNRCRPRMVYFGHAEMCA